MSIAPAPAAAPPFRPAARLVFALSVVAGCLGAQQVPLPTAPTAQQPGFLPTQPIVPIQGQGGQGQGPVQQQQPYDPFGNDGMTPTWMAPTRPDFDGFPVFPSRLSGYGNYPLPVDPRAAAGGIGLPPMLLPPAEPEPPGWPAWVRTRLKEPLPFGPDAALLVRDGDRVWWRPTADDAFVPLFFHQKFVTLPPGGECEVRRTGEFALFLHTTTRIEARGPTALRLEAMDEAGVAVQLPRLTWLRIRVTGREHTFTLPDGSQLLVSGDEAAADEPAGEQPAATGFPGFGQPAPDAAGSAALGLAMLFGALGDGRPAALLPAAFEVVRADEPGWFGGRATISNLGGRPITWRHAFGDTVIAPSQRVTMFLSRPGAPTAAGLDAGEARVEAQGGDVTCRSASATEVRWCGARIALPAGAAVTFESLQGNAFEPAPVLGEAVGRAGG